MLIGNKINRSPMKGGREKQESWGDGNKITPSPAVHRLDRQRLTVTASRLCPLDSGPQIHSGQTQSSPESNGFPVCLEGSMLGETSSSYRMRHTHRKTYLKLLLRILGVTLPNPSHLSLGGRRWQNEVVFGQWRVLSASSFLGYTQVDTANTPMKAHPGVPEHLAELLRL